MTRQRTLIRPTLALVLLALVGSLVGAAPARPAHAEGFEATVFRSGFAELATGALAVGVAKEVTVGSVVASAAPAEIASVTGSDDRALVVSGAGAAGLRFSSYPDELPQALNSQRYELVVKATLIAPAANVAGASLYLATSGGTRYEIVGFGADGKLARAGASLGLAYSAGGAVRVEARFDLKNGRMQLKLKTAAGELERGDIALPGSFSPDSVGQLIFAAGGAAGRYGVDTVEVRVEKDDEKKGEPAKIRIDQPTYTIEVENGVSLVVLLVTIDSSGGLAKDVFLTINLSDDELDLLDLSFLSGIGYVKEKGDGKLVIGIGEYNRIRKGSFQLKLKLKVKAKGDQELKLDLKYTIAYSDSDGRHDTAPLTIVVIVPAIIVVGPAPTPAPTVPPTTTLPISLTLPIERLPIAAIDVRFRGRWDDGGLRLYGLPLTQPISLSSGIIVQYFERARFEYHPENEGGEYVILLGLLGVELGYVQPPVAPPTSTADLEWYFAPTGHTIVPQLRGFWRVRGGLAAFGYPIGEPTLESTGLIVQYFERARLEYHPEFAGSANEVLLGLLGEEQLIQIAGRQ